ncbi:MAG: TAXI family TRAP transporter solute-binding subunit [Spirochaetes bacterium]|nr:TAXI family TRAP transporter solute-binding subunit [Spirochaetota bacterium]
MIKKTIFGLAAAAMIFSGCAGEQDGRTSITIGTAGAAGTYFIIGAAMAQTVNNHSDFLNVTAQVTMGSVQNLNLVNMGEIEFGMSNADGVYWATTGTGMFDGMPLNISAVMTLYLSVGQIATHTRTGIESWADLRGRRVVLGPPGTTIIEMSRAILRGYGIDPDNDITPIFLSFAEGLSELIDGTVDASFFVAAAPTAAMVQATATGSVFLLDATPEILENVSAEHPFFLPFSIPVGTYPGMDRDINTLKIMTEIFANNNVPEDVVYEFLRITLDNTGDFVDSHVAAQEINLETAASSVSRYHPGAVRFFRERGVMP